MLRLYNTLTRKKEDFLPLDPRSVRMYVCGPTVYDFAHIGNARPVIVFDVLYRVLRHLYGPEHVTYVRNITDVDDKINARAAERKISIRELTDETYGYFKTDVAALGCLPPGEEPRATEFIRRDDGKIDMVSLIDRLAQLQNAYVAENHVLFYVPSMPDYGQLSKRSLDEMLAGARVEVAPYKRNPMDFVLWKPSDEQQTNYPLPKWRSPCGINMPGRPGWHIECSAMAGALLGETFDIHGGGADLIFPHHENEIAQSRCAFHTSFMARYWMHNGFLQVEGEKMAKSLGNFVTVHELLEGWQGYAWPGEALRFNMLRTQYRQPLDWTLVGLDEAHKTLWEWYGDLEGKEEASGVPGPVLDALLDDLNTPKAITELHKLHSAGHWGGLRAALCFLGFSGERANIRRVAPFISGGWEDAANTVIAAHHARRRPLGGTTIVDVPMPLARDDEIKRRIAERNLARQAKNFREADRIRDELAAMGIILKDAKDPKTGELVTTWETAR